MRLPALLLALALTSLPVLAQQEIVLRPPVQVFAAAVAETPDGLVGTLANVSITVADGGSGHVFIDTYPLTQVDMQGSARLAVKVAASVAGVDTSSVDVFFVVRSGSSVIGGPSAGGVLTVGTLAALANLTVDGSVMMTGTINPDGTIGPVGGVPQKAAAAAEANARMFLVPAGQETVRDRQGDEVVEVNMTEYCREELRIVCRQVVDVQEAALLMTGHDFRRPPPTGEVQDDDFRQILRPKGAELLRLAEADVDGAHRRLDAAEPSDAFDRFLDQQLRTADDALDAARASLVAEQYYTTASKAFQAAIAARTVNWTLAYADADEPSALLGDLKDATRRRVDDVAALAHDADWSTLGKVDGVGSAQMKAREAQGLVTKAEGEMALAVAGAEGQDLAAIHDLAYAWERADTVPFWLEIAADTPDGLPVQRQAVVDLANDVADAAQESMTYALEILRQAGGGPVDQLQTAARLLNQSRADLAAGNVPGALLQAIEADVRSGLALTLAGYSPDDVPPELLDAARVRAARAIADAREDGLEPVLAVSYYEFAPAVPGVAEQLAFYRSAHAAAHLQELLAGVERGPVESRFVGEGRLPDLWVPKEYLVAFFALGCAVGVVAAVGAAVLSKREDPGPPVSSPRPAPASDPRIAPPPPPVPPPPAEPPGP